MEERQSNETYFSSTFINLVQSSAALVRHVSSSISTSVATATDSVTSLFRKKGGDECVSAETKLVKEFIDDLAKRYRSNRRVRLLHKRFDERNISYDGDVRLEELAEISCVEEEGREIYKIRVSTSSKTHLKDQMMVCLGHMMLDDIEAIEATSIEASCNCNSKQELYENIAFLNEEWDEFEETIVMNGPLWLE